MLDDISGRFTKAIFWGGAAVLTFCGVWTFLNVRDGSGGGAQLTGSIMGMVGGAGAMGLAFLFGTLDTSFAG